MHSEGISPTRQQRQSHVGTTRSANGQGDMWRMGIFDLPQTIWAWIFLMLLVALLVALWITDPRHHRRF
jgi:hypothetical protein